VQHYCKQIGITCYGNARPIVWADADNAAYVPSDVASMGAPASPGIAPPSSPGGRASQMQGQADGEYEFRSFTSPVLGFLPPQDERGAVRVRKSKSRRAAAQQMNAIGGDG
jgi:hypothetical protein